MKTVFAGFQIESGSRYTGIEIIPLFRAMKESAWDLLSAMSVIGLEDLAWSDPEHHHLRDELEVADLLYSYILENNTFVTDDGDMNDRKWFIENFPIEWDT